ncbi:hypothetical protein D9758_002442 [Tetrapyrgos nigripes]|uniref:Uncharacterized protein n=1 Tax=Tetrapyrgos nigripes TaxID=182062 RepID=A0A8H5LSG3_9AGAR|nr:hypothetical protein D9758_002442 [Tetrapyrgos nigripes]
MKISSSSSLIFATLAISSSSSSLAAPTPANDASQAVGVAHNHFIASRRGSVSVPRAEVNNIDNDRQEEAEESHQAERRDLGCIVHPLAGSLLGGVAEPVLDTILSLVPLNPASQLVGALLCPSANPTAQDIRSASILLSTSDTTAGASSEDQDGSNDSKSPSDSDNSNNEPTADEIPFYPDHASVKEASDDDSSSTTTGSSAPPNTPIPTSTADDSSSVTPTSSPTSTTHSRRRHEHLRRAQLSVPNSLSVPTESLPIGVPLQVSNLPIPNSLPISIGSLPVPPQVSNSPIPNGVIPVQAPGVPSNAPVNPVGTVGSVAAGTPANATGKLPGSPADAVNPVDTVGTVAGNAPVGIPAAAGNVVGTVANNIPIVAAAADAPEEDVTSTMTTTTVTTATATVTEMDSASQTQA